MERLNQICGGWTTSATMHISPDPKGGIIDYNPVLKLWFVIFNDHRVCNDWFDSFDQAVDYFIGA